MPGDPTRLAQVLANLLANARAHTPPGTAVTVGLRAGADGAELSVTDEGPGIAPELLPHVFERFARGSTSRSRQHGSTGLGLSIVDAVVTAHGGRVAVTSAPGRPSSACTATRRRPERGAPAADPCLAATGKPAKQRRTGCGARLGVVARVAVSEFSVREVVPHRPELVVAVAAGQDVVAGPPWTVSPGRVAVGVGGVVP